MDEKLNISVLFVEDEKVLRIIYQKILQHYVEEIYLAEDGEEGLELYHQHHPDLIISDIQLPRINGLEMIEEIRKRDEETKIIIISAYSEASYFIDAIKLQVNGFLLKPIERESLLQQVRNISKVINLEREYKVQQAKREEAEENLKQLNQELEKRIEESIIHLKKEIKDRKKAESALRKLNISLEQRVKEELEAREKQRELLIQKSKLESIGELAAGMAHEINQPLLGISMGLDNILFKIHSGELKKDYIIKKFDYIFNDIDRIKSIIEHVRIFSRDQDLSYNEKINIAEVIENSLSLINRQYNNHNIQIKTHCSNESLFTIGNKFRLEQVVLNLLSNSKAAVDERDKAGTNSQYQKEIEVFCEKRNDTILITVKDNGTGINQKNIDLIFDPFFSTKEAHKGTGLGLSITYGIIQEMKGNIQVESTEMEGTRVIIELPAAT